MAKKSKIEMNKKRIAMAAKYASKRAELKAIIDNQKSTDEERYDAQLGLQRLPRNSNPTRIRRRCSLTGRPRGNLRKFGINRIKFRELAHRGEIPGVRKSSW